jgi:hypothetical protein
MAREFEELALDEHNYATWVLDVKIRLTFREILPALSPPADREAIFLYTYKSQALLRIITNAVLGLLLSLRSITMRRKLALPMIQIQRRMVDPLDADAIEKRAGSSQRQ